MRSIITTLSSALVAVVLAAGVVAANPTASDAATGSGAGYVKTCTGGSIYLNADEKRTLALHNNIRRNHNLRPFCVHPNLTKDARAHSKDMLARNYFSHYTKGSGAGPGKRLAQANYNWRTYGENIAWGSGSYGDPGHIMKSWMNSRGHRANILNRGFREIGLGTANGTYNGYKNSTLYTATFGTR